MLAVVFLVMGTKANGQTQKQDSVYFAREYLQGMAILNKARAFNDIDMEKEALYKLLVLDERDTSVLMSLAQLYFNSGNFTSSVLVSLDFLNKHPGNITALEIAALSYEQLRIYDKAVQFYEDLYLRRQNINVLYQIAYLQYALKRFDESSNNLNILESKSEGAANMQFPKADGAVQEVPVMAAVLNLKGLIAKEQGNTEEAKRMFNEAIKLAPDFEAPKISIEEINKG